MRATADEIRKAFAVGRSGAGGEQAAAATGTGWATLKGRFVFDGDAADDAALQRDQGTQTSAPTGGSAPLQETLLVDGSTKGIKNVAVYLRDASRVHDSAKPSDEPVVFDQKECVFLTHVLPVTVGQTRRHQEQRPDRPQHEHRRQDELQPDDSGRRSRSPFKLQKEEATPAQVTCSIHPWMIAYMLPRKNGYFAVTDAGRHVRNRQPAGGRELEIQVWHEQLRPARAAWSSNTPEAKELKWTNKGRFRSTLQQDEVDEIEINVPASAFKG